MEGRQPLEEGLLDAIVSEPSSVYETSVALSEPYINPFVDWAFKRIFASQSSKEVVRAFLNGILEGRREIETIAFGKNEYPGEISEEAGSVLDFVCTDTDGAVFLVEVQRQKHDHFKDRSVFYASRLISDQAPKGGGSGWKYKLMEIYSISLLERFSLPDTQGEFMHNIALCNTGTGEIFFNKLHFIYIEVMKFDKQEAELSSALDQWMYALKHASKMKEEPVFLNAPGISEFFYLAKYANLTMEERNMYRTAQQIQWDNYSVLDTAKNEGIREGLQKGLEMVLARQKDIALKMKQDGLDIEMIVKYTKLPKEEIEAL